MLRLSVRDDAIRTGTLRAFVDGLSWGNRTVSTVSEHSQTYADPDEFIQFQVDQARNRIKSTDLMTAGVLTGLLLIGYVLTFTLLDHWVVAGGFRPVTRAVMLAVVLTLCTELRSALS